MKIQPYKYLLVAVAFAHLSCTNVATLRAPSPRVQTFDNVNTNRLATMVGNVSDEIGNRLVGAVIQLFRNTAPEPLKADTGAAVDLEGKYKLINLLPGLYRIKASQLGCKSQEVPDLQVNRNQLLIIDFVLDTVTIHGIE